MNIVKSPRPLSEEGITWHEYLNHYEGECSKMEPKINDACSTIASNNSIVLKAEVLTIKGLISGLTIASSWQDVIGESYQNVITSCANSLGEVVNSISETFKSSEDVYRKLQAWLVALSANNENYSAYNAKKPNKGKACYYDIVTKTDPITNATSTEKVFNEKVYKSDLQKWASNMERYYDQVIRLEEEIEDFLSQLDSYNGSSVSIDTSGSFSVSLNKMQSDIENMPAISQEQMEELLKLYGNRADPFITRVSQSRTNYGGHGNYLFGSGYLSNKGCGVFALSSALSCGLSTAYDENVMVYPNEMLDSLYALGGGRNYKNTYYAGGMGLSYATSKGSASKITTDMTAAFKDVCIVEFPRDGSPVLTKEEAEAITDAGGSIALSLNGAHHFVTITKNDGNGKFYVTDSGGYHSSTDKAISFGTRMTDSDNNNGSLTGKKAWAVFPRSAVTVTSNGVKFNNGLSTSDMPTIAAVEVDGKAYNLDGTSAKVV